MLSPKSLSSVALIILGMTFAGANIWFAAARSTIPWELHGNIAQKERLIEKTPGVDDVYILTLDSGRRIQVDGPVFDAVAAHQSVRKRAWTRIIEIDGKNIALGWSPDFRGMLAAMPLTVVVCVFLGMMAVKRPLPNADEGARTRIDRVEDAVDAKRHIGGA